MSLGMEFGGLVLNAYKFLEDFLVIANETYVPFKANY